MKQSLVVGACQTPEILGDVEAALICIENFASEAEAKKVDMLLFPECFLQGYLVEKEHLNKYAVKLDSAEFGLILQRLAGNRPVLVFGLIELRKGSIFNSAVVVDAGKIIGVYRKAHLTPGEYLFESGTECPIFELKGIKYGINICFDTQFADGAALLAAQGAKLMLVPAQNMMRRGNAEKLKNQHNHVRAERVKETGMWLVSSDVTGQRDESRIAYGPTAIINSEAELVAQVPLMQTGMVVAEIWQELLKPSK